MTSWTRLYTCGLLLWAAGGAASEEPAVTAVDAAFLEFLGTWDAEDDQWLGAAISAVESDTPTDEMVDEPASETGDGTTETEDDDE